MERERARRKLVDLLRRAHAGELAAARAYAGHWRSVTDPEERRRIHAIEEDEWRHRWRVREMLGELGEEPCPRREAFFGALGSFIGALCHVTGWLAPMFGAGKLEAGNIGEYEEAARAAHDSGNGHLAEDLLEMAEVEHDHEAYFRERVLSHPLGRRLPLWSRPPPRAAIAAGYRDFLHARAAGVPLRA